MRIYLAFSVMVYIVQGGVAEMNSNILLVGNGILRAFNSCSCDEWIHRIVEERRIKTNKDDLDSLSFPQRIVVASGDHVDDEVKKYAEQNVHVKNTTEQDAFYRELLSLEMDAFLTTNYTFELENSIYGEFGRNLHWKKRQYVKEKLTKSDKNSSIYEYICLDGAGTKKLFHIHGDLHRTNSMVIGHYYYGKLLSSIQKQVPVTIRNKSIAMKNGSEFVPRNWIDYFLTSRVYVMGFGMDLSELDLWWLVCCKKRNNLEEKIVFFETEEDLCKSPGKKLLLETYGVDVRCIPSDGDYRHYYYDVLEDIKQDLKHRQVFEKQKGEL